MRYRLRITRVQTIDRTVTATDEESAMAKVRAELERPFGYIGAWRDHGYEVEVLGLENPLPQAVEEVPGGPLLYDLASAAGMLGIGRTLLYELIGNGELEHVRIGRRILISRVSMERFIEAHSQVGERCGALLPRHPWQR